ncbi:MAG: nucleotidyltransferase family protein [Bacteroidales bacterium]|nr:nucleotidyltransferase family protein [Bacteroidales bacterium]
MYTIDTLLNLALTEDDLQLIRLSLSEEPGQESLDAFLDGWDMDSAPMTVAVLLSYLMKMHPELAFPESLRPRLGGLLSYCRFQYLKLVGQFGTYCHALEEAGIRFLVMKGGAMKALRPDFPRWMGDIDLLVRQEDFRRASQIASEAGFTICPSEQSIDLKKDGRNVLDVHQYVMMHTGRERAANEGFFERASRERIFSVEALLPSREDLLFITLVNLVRNLADETSRDSIIYAFFDVNFLVEAQKDHSFDWGVVRRDAAITGTTGYLEVARRFLCSVVPGLIPDGVLEPVSEEGVGEVLTWIRFRREVLRPERDIIEEFNPFKALRSGKRPIPYVAQRLRFALHKRLQHFDGACKHILARHSVSC